MTHSVPRWVEPYIGLPFDEEVQHCWWLVRKVLKDFKGIDVPNYAGSTARDLLKVARFMKQDSQSDIWTPVTTLPNPFDVVLMLGKAGGKLAEIHAGITVTPEHILHIEEGTSSVVLPLSHPRIKHRIRGYYRHKELIREAYYA